MQTRWTIRLFVTVHQTSAWRMGEAGSLMFASFAKSGTGAIIKRACARARNKEHQQKVGRLRGRQRNEAPIMCDYSLLSVASRPAKAGDKLVTTSFPTSTTRGFAAIDESAVAVCLLPGTELAFGEEIEWRRPLFGIFQKKPRCGKLARFRQVNTERTDAHHDAIEFPNGQIVLLTDLHPGQRATVLQLPVVTQMGRDDHLRSNRLNAPIIDVVPNRSHSVDHT